MRSSGTHITQTSGRPLGEAVDWDEVLGGYEATTDWPACTFYEQLMERYPDAKVLLSVRDPEQWYESTRNTIYALVRIGNRSPFTRLGFGLLLLFKFGVFNMRPLQITEFIVERTFEGNFEDKHHALEVFTRHNEEVKRRVPKERLLVHEVKEGWGPLCEFLGVEEPDKPFPRLNDAADMRRRIRSVQALSLAVPAVLALLAVAILVFLGRRGGS